MSTQNPGDRVRATLSGPGFELSPVVRVLIGLLDRELTTRQQVTGGEPLGGAALKGTRVARPAQARMTRPNSGGRVG